MDYKWKDCIDSKILFQTSFNLICLFIKYFICPMDFNKRVSKDHLKSIKKKANELTVTRGPSF